MTERREGNAGILPASAPAVRDIPGAQSGLSVAGAARSEPFVVTGERCIATGVQSRDGVEVDFDSGARTGVRASLGTAANLVTFPGLVRREFIGPGGSVSEVLLCAPSIPMAVVQWSGDGRPGLIEVTCGRSEPVERSDFGVVLRLEEDQYVAAMVAPTPKGIDLDTEGGIVRLHTDTESNATLSIVLCAGNRADVTRALKAAPHLSGHVLRATAGPEREGLYMETGVAEIDDGVAWARARLGTILPLRSTPSDDEVLRWGVAALASGDEEIAREVFERLEHGDPRRAFMAGRMALTLGDAGPATTTAESVIASPESWKRTDPWHRTALDSLAAGLHNSAPELVEALGSLRTSAPEPGGGARRLPVIGAAPSPPGEAELLWALLSGVDPAGTQTADPDAAWRSWRESLAVGLEDGPLGPATWDGAPGRGRVTPDLLLTFVHRILGIGPDAPSGRLRIAPRLPAHLTRLSVGGIRIGAARMRLNVERLAGVDRYEFVPEFAGVPPLLVFEPVATGPVKGVRIDGAPAVLDRRTEHGRTVVPVQLPLDGIRVVEVIGEVPEAAGPGGALDAGVRVTPE